MSKVPETLLVGWSSFNQTDVFTGAGPQRSKVIEIGRALSLNLGQTGVIFRGFSIHLPKCLVERRNVKDNFFTETNKFAVLKMTETRQHLAPSEMIGSRWETFSNRLLLH